MFNFTLYIKTCKNENIIWQGSDNPLVTIRGIDVNYTKNVVCVGFSCKIEYPLPGNYSVEIIWLGLRVFSQILYLNGSQSTVIVRANISNVMISVYTLDGKELRELKVTLRVGSSELSVLSGQRLALPHGQVAYEVYSARGFTKATGVSNVDCNTVVLRVNLGVFDRLLLTFRLLDGLPAVGLNGSAKIFYRGADKEVEIKEVDLRSSSEVEIAEAPTGKYRITVLVAGKLFEEKTLEVTVNSSSYTITLGIVSSTAVRILDVRGNIIQDERLEVIVVDPLDRIFKANLSKGLLALSYAPLGSYALSIYNTRWGIQLGTYVFTVASAETFKSLEVPTNLAKSLIRVRPSGSQTLPSDSHILLKYIDIVIFTERLSEEKNDVIIEPGYLPLGAILYLTFRYGYFMQEEVLRVTSEEKLVEIQLYDVKLTVLDLDKNPLRNCDIILYSKYFNYSYKLDKDILLKHLPLTDVRIFVKCAGFEVLRTTLTPEELKGKNTTLVTHVGSVAVYVRSWFNKPVPGALVKIAVSNPSGTAEYLAQTDQSGFALVKSVPLLPEANITLTVSFKNLVYERSLDINTRSYEIFLDVFIDTPFFVLSLSQAIMITIVILFLTVVMVFMYTRSTRLKIIKNMFEEPLGEAEEVESKRLLKRLRNILSKKKKEEREEELFFGF